MEELFDYDGPRNPQDDGGVVECPSGRRRGRPKKTTNELVAYDIRITPHTQEEIDFNAYEHLVDFDKFLACKEYGKLGGKLHYHVYATTRLSDSTLRLRCIELAGSSGNGAYSKKIAHNGTQGYVVKDEVIVCKKGFTDSEIEEIVGQSRAYRNTVEATRKSASRSKEKFLAKVVEEVVASVTADDSPFSVMKKILDVYASKQIRFPARTTLENTVMTIMYKYHPMEVVRYYAKNISYDISYNN